MAIAVPSISAVSEAGHRGIDIRDDFVTKQEAFQDDVTGTFVPEINATITNMNVLVDDVNILVPVADDMAILSDPAIIVDMATLGPVATQIGNLGTADAVADMNLLAVPAVITDMDTLSPVSVEIGVVGDDIEKGIGTNQPTDSAILNALTNATDAAASASAASTSEGNAGTSETNAASSEDSAQLYKWEAEAWKLTAQSYATEAEDVLVNLVTSDGDGTYTYTPQTTIYSALHWQIKAEAHAASIDPLTLVHKTDYATSTVGGAVKARIDGSAVYLTIDGTDA